MTGNGLRALGSACALWCLLSGGCGGDDDGGGVSTGLPQNQKLSELTTDDLMTACETVADSLSNVISDDEERRIGCTAQAIPGSVVMKDGKPQGDIAKCKQLVDECLAAPEPATDDDGQLIDTDFESGRDCSADDTAKQFEGCSATVAEYEDCINASLAAIDNLFSAISCDSLANLEEVMGRFQKGLEIESLPACEAVKSKCPGIDLGGDEEESGASEP